MALSGDVPGGSGMQEVREKKGEGRQEGGCLHIGEVKGASGVTNDCGMPVEVGSGISGRRGLKQQKGC